VSWQLLQPATKLLGVNKFGLSSLSFQKAFLSSLLHVCFLCILSLSELCSVMRQLTSCQRGAVLQPTVTSLSAHPVGHLVLLTSPPHHHPSPHPSIPTLVQVSCLPTGLLFPHCLLQVIPPAAGVLSLRASHLLGSFSMT
jgi:hypothetical protein